MPFTFGPQPEKLKVNLAEDAEFTLTLEIPVLDEDGTPLEPWPEDAALEFRFVMFEDPPVIWTAEIDPDNNRIMSWNIDPDGTAPLLTAFRAGNIKAARWYFDDAYKGKGEVVDVT